MTLFNYGECKCCKKMQNNNNVELSKLLPSNICNKITDHNIYCVKCCNVFEREQRLLRVKGIHDYDKFYLQLKVFLKSHIRFLGSVLKHITIRIWMSFLKMKI